MYLLSDDDDDDDALSFSDDDDDDEDACIFFAQNKNPFSIDQRTPPKKRQRKWSKGFSSRVKSMGCYVFYE